MKKYLDFEGVKYLWSKIKIKFDSLKQEISKKVVDTIDATSVDNPEAVAPSLKAVSEVLNNSDDIKIYSKQITIKNSELTKKDGYRCFDVVMTDERSNGTWNYKSYMLNARYYRNFGDKGPSQQYFATPLMNNDMTYRVIFKISDQDTYEEDYDLIITIYWIKNIDDFRLLFVNTFSESNLIDEINKINSKIKELETSISYTIKAVSATEEYIEVDIPDSMLQNIDEEFMMNDNEIDAEFSKNKED